MLLWAPAVSPEIPSYRPRLVPQILTVYSAILAGIIFGEFLKTQIGSYYFGTPTVGIFTFITNSSQTPMLIMCETMEVTVDSCVRGDWMF